MNKGQKVIAGLLGVVVAELAVLDYAAVMSVRNGMQVEITVDDLQAARAAFEEDLTEEGGIELSEESE